MYTLVHKRETGGFSVFWKSIHEKSDLQEHKNCGEMTEIEAKVKYVKLARSLRTYGVSFFLVKVSF